VRARVADSSGAVYCIWFNQPYMADRFTKGSDVVVSGTATSHEGQLQMVNPICEVVAEADAPQALEAVSPVYPLTEGLSQGMLRKIIRHALDRYAGDIVELFPEAYRKRLDMLPVREAAALVHFPRDEDTLAAARRRLIYEELFLLQIALALRKRAVKGHAKPHRVAATDKIDQRIRRLFPFELTGDQNRSVGQITHDMTSPYPMNRLLQGDVASGKTVVAVYAILLAIANHLQVALMVPTEILAQQHHRTITHYLRGARVRHALLTGSTPAAERTRMLRAAAKGELDLIIGTHALFNERLRFATLGLIVVDEQHKFGVAQRTALRAKGFDPDCLVMTATPIPRTLTLTVFGDLDVSTLDESPPGRTKVTTRVVSASRIDEVFTFVRKNLRLGHQAFFVYPVVEKGDALGLKTATDMFDHLRRDVFPHHRVALLHGQMHKDRKRSVMTAFAGGKVNVLVATSVVEVGIDVPNANVMVIEHADRYGLNQLHQLRGRIGRSHIPSYCILVADPRSPEAAERLRTLVKTDNGFRIAEQDLKLRGPGEFFGLKQHGLPELKLANVIEHYDLLKLAKRDAFALVGDDPELARPEHGALAKRVRQTFADRLDYASIG